MKWRSDDEIAKRIATMVATGEIKREYAHMYEKTLRDEQAGKCITMNSLGRAAQHERSQQRLPRAQKKLERAAGFKRSLFVPTFHILCHNVERERGERARSQ